MPCPIIKSGIYPSGIVFGSFSVLSAMSPSPTGGCKERQSLVTLEVANFKGMMEGVRGGGLGH